MKNGCIPRGAKSQLYGHVQLSFKRSEPFNESERPPLAYS